MYRIIKFYKQNLRDSMFKPMSSELEFDSEDVYKSSDLDTKIYKSFIVNGNRRESANTFLINQDSLVECEDDLIIEE